MNIEHLKPHLEKIETYEDCPLYVDLLVWDGCDWHIEHVDMCSNSGAYFPANGVEFSHFIELPKFGDMDLEGFCDD